jgi:hypothetical protein
MKYTLLLKLLHLECKAENDRLADLAHAELTLYICPAVLTLKTVAVSCAQPPVAVFRP